MAARAGNKGKLISTSNEEQKNGNTQLDVL
jgi:hypothetical protein